MKAKLTATLPWSASTLLVATLLTGCASATTDRLAADQPEAQDQIKSRLLETFRAAEQRDLVRLDSYHLYGPKFTKYSAATSHRQDATSARSGEHTGLAAIQNLKMQAENLQIDVFGEVGIATFILNYNFQVSGETIERQEQSTLVFVNDHDNWKIVHEHFSPVIPNP